MNLGTLFASLLYGVVAPVVGVGLGAVFGLGAILTGLLSGITI